MDVAATKIARENAIILGARRALLMQLAHPKVAAGADEHSDYREHPYRRFMHTLDFSMTMVFGSDQQRAAWIEEVNRKHDTVRGRMTDPDVRPGIYSAQNPSLKLWVHATLVESAVITYEAFVGRLTQDETDKYYEASKLGAILLGIPAEMLPATYRDLQAYIRRMIESGEVKVTARTRDLARKILNPLPVPKMLYRAINTVTAGLLPEKVRKGYGLEFGIYNERAFNAAAKLIRILLPITPGLVRFNPYSRKLFWQARRNIQNLRLLRSSI